MLLALAAAPIPSKLPSTACVRAVPHRLKATMYDCPKCDKSFTRPENLQRHLRNSHRDEKNPFRCVCGRSYTRSDILLRHQRTCATYAATPSTSTSNLPSSSSSSSRTRSNPAAQRSVSLDTLPSASISASASASTSASTSTSTSTSLLRSGIPTAASAPSSPMPMADSLAEWEYPVSQAGSMSGSEAGSLYDDFGSVQSGEMVASPNWSVATGATATATAWEQQQAAAWQAAYPYAAYSTSAPAAPTYEEPASSAWAPSLPLLQTQWDSGSYAQAAASTSYAQAAASGPYAPAGVPPTDEATWPTPTTANRQWWAWAQEAAAAQQAAAPQTQAQEQEAYLQEASTWQSTLPRPPSEGGTPPQSGYGPPS